MKNVEELVEGNEKVFCIVRGRISGVFAGDVIKIADNKVTIKNAIRIWHWEGACSISQLAEDGTAKPEGCRFSVPVSEIIVLDAIEIDRCSKKAKKSIFGVKPWKF